MGLNLENWHKERSAIREFDMIGRSHGLLATQYFPVLIFGLIVVMNLVIPDFAFSQQFRFEVFSTTDGRSFKIYPLPDELLRVQESFLGLASYQDSLLFLWGEKLAFLIIILILVYFFCKPI